MQTNLAAAHNEQLASSFSVTNPCKAMQDAQQNHGLTRVRRRSMMSADVGAPTYHVDEWKLVA